MRLEEAKRETGKEERQLTRFNTQAYTRRDVLLARSEPRIPLCLLEYVMQEGIVTVVIHCWTSALAIVSLLGLISVRVPSLYALHAVSDNERECDERVGAWT
jgi:hypothetical protein